MSIEERMEYHEQWLRSLESGHSQIVADLGAIDRRLSQLSEIVVTLGQNQGALMAALASLTTRVDGLTANVEGLTANVEGLTANVEALTANVEALTAKVDSLAEHHLKLERTLERYIRFQGNGGQKN